ncbi:MAG: midasin, partial [Bacillariaceae sp.]
VLNQTLYAVNCHATTETSDLIGGLRPVRGRDAIKKKIVAKLTELIQKWPYDDMLDDLNLHEYTSVNNCDTQELELYDVETMVALAKIISSRRPEILDEQCTNERTKKKRKIIESSSPSKSNSDRSANDVESLAMIAVEIEELGRRFRALFEWSDGPLVKAMKSGELLLLDEMSLAEDAVLERLNSVLEPSRSLVLAEKGDDGSSTIGKDNRIIVAHDQFRIFATMNPGGDFGKRELSPALRSRFTEIWVPSITERSDFEVVLGRSLAPSLSQQINTQQASIIGCILDYVEWFNSDVCGVPSSPYAGYSLSLRDILSWAHFIVEARKSNANLAMWDALYHGACLMHLDGLGLGSGLASDASTALKLKAEQHLLSLVPDGSISNVRSVDDSFCIQNGQFGVFPYFVNVGKSIIPDSTFDMTAPTTS